MGERKEGDARVHLIICLFFICILAGGVLLSLYIFLPDTASSPWYYLVGITLEAIPWAFWLFAYIYTCFKPRKQQEGQQPPIAGGSTAWKPPSIRTNSTAAAAAAASAPAPTSPVPASPTRDANRHVHFGEVVIVGANNEGGGGQEHSASNDAHADGSKES